MKSIYEFYQGRGKDSLLHRNLRMCTEEGLFATPFVVLSIPGNIFIAALLTNVLGISGTVYGWIVSMPAWANALQLIFIPILARRFSSRSLTVVFSLLNCFAWLLLVLSLHKLPEAGEGKIVQLLLVYFLLISISQSLAGVAWMSWIQEWIPGRLRGKYFGRRNALLGFTTVGFIAFISLMFERFGESILAFQVILGVTVLFRFLSIYMLTHIYTPWSQPEKMIHEGWGKNIAKIRQNQPFMRYLAFASILAFMMTFTGPFIPIFMSDYLDFSVSNQATLIIVANLASAVAMPLWGKLCDRYGCRPVITITAIGWMIQNYFWVVITPSSNWILYPMWLVGGTLSGGVILGGFNLILKLTPQDAKSSAVSIHLAITSVAAALAPVLTGYILELERWLPITEISLYRILFFIQPTSIILSLFILKSVDEPKARSLVSFSGAFRTMRMGLVQNGLFLVGNLTFFRNKSRKHPPK